MNAETTLIWHTIRSLTVTNVPPRPIAFCGIARPQRFIDQLRARDIQIVTKFFFDDHHPYSLEDVKKLEQLRQKHTAGGFITTEKDMINLGGLASVLGTLAVAQVTMQLEDPSRCMDSFLQRISITAK